MTIDVLNANGISIRHELRPGDLGWIAHRHGVLYGRENGYGIEFEVYVAEGLAEFYKAFDASFDRVWICEKDDRIVGFLLLMHRGEKTAQLRYFYLEPEVRDIGLGGELMRRFMDALGDIRYENAYLWTTHEQTAAAALYERHGFRLTVEKTSDAFGKPLTEQKFELDLTI